MPGVKGLAAMFEQRGSETSPPDLARGTPPLTDAPRPLSKIRTQFVAVEKDGRVGLTRGVSTDSVKTSSRRGSNETESSIVQPRSEPTSDPYSGTSAAPKNVASDPTSAPPSAPQSRPASPQKHIPAPAPVCSRMSPNKGKSAPDVMPNANPDKVTDEKETKTKLQPGLPTDKLATRGGQKSGSNGNGDASKSDTAMAPPPKPQSSAAATSKAPKPAPSSVSTAKTVSKAPNSPVVTKPPKSPIPPTKAPKSQAPAEKGTVKPTEKPSTTNFRESRRKPAAPSNTAPATNNKKPASLDFPQNGIGFVKPKVKSPTRPVKLPAGLTTHTASSSSRTNVGAPASTGLQPGSSVNRSQSLAPRSSSQRPASRISNTGTGTGGKTLRRQSSTIHVGRPTIGGIGPPPKQNPSGQSPPRKEHQVDESFLARMMRPTQSSANKTADKAPVTPPRKQSTPKAIPKKAIGADAAGSAKKSAAKLQAATSTNGKDTTPVKSKSLGPEIKVAPAAKDATPALESDRQTAKSESIQEKEVATAALEDKMTNLTIKDGDNIADVQTRQADAAETVQQADSTDKSDVVAESEVTAEQELATEPEVAPNAEGSTGLEESPLTKTSDAAEADTPAATVPAVSDEPFKVEDIEDVVHDVTDKTLVASEVDWATGDASAVAGSDDEVLKRDTEDDAKDATTVDLLA